VRVYRFYNKLAFPRLGVIQHYIRTKEQADALAEEHMLECIQMMSRMKWFVGDYCTAEDPETLDRFLYDFGFRPSMVVREHWLQHKERLKLVQYCVENKARIRSLYMRCSMMMVSSPEKCFRLSRPQLEKMMRDTGLNKEFPETDLTSAWAEVHKAVPKKVKIVSEGGKKSIAGRTKKRKEDDLELNLAQFLEMCLYLACHVYETLDPETGAARSVTDRFKILLEDRLAPLLQDPKAPFSLDPLSVEDSSLEEVRELPEVKAVLATYQNRMKKFYKKYGGKTQSGDEDLDIMEFMGAMSSLKLIDGNLSNGQAMEVFVRCNQDEVLAYLTAMPDDKEIMSISASFSEFMDCLLVCSASQDKKNTIDVRLQNFLERILAAC